MPSKDMHPRAECEIIFEGGPNRDAEIVVSPAAGQNNSRFDQ